MFLCFSPYSSGFRSYSTELRTDVHGFWSIQGFFYEIGENIVVLGNFRSYSICFSSYSSEFSILYYTEMRTNIQVFWTFLGVSRIKLEKILSFWRTLDLILEVLVIIPVSFRSCNSETRTDVHGFWSIQGFFYEI